MLYPFVRSALLFVLLVAFATGRTLADDGTDRRAESAETIELGELIDPPKDIAKLIDVGKVTLFYGRKPWQEIAAARDRVGVSGRRLRLLGETKFELDYDYQSRSSWRIREGRERQLRVSVRYTRANLNYQHKVWFRRRPPTDGFWDDELVRHEFDHVSISTKTILTESFLKKLRASPVFTKKIGQSEKVNDAMVRKLIDERVQGTFDDLVDLISIRYKELDRITEHGQRPVPKETSLRSWLDRGFDQKDSDPNAAK